MELMTLYAVMNGIPAKHIVRYAAVPETASAGVDITITTGFTRHISSIVMGMDTAMKSVAVLPITSDAFFLSPAQHMHDLTAYGNRRCTCDSIELPDYEQIRHTIKRLQKI